MFGVKVVGPKSDKESGWAVRNLIDANGNVFVGTRKYLDLAEKFKTLEEAEEVAFLLGTQKPNLLGRIRIMNLRQSELDKKWMVDGPCTQSG